MENVGLEFDYIVEDEELEIDVEVNYRCWFTATHCFYPMNVSGSIFKGCSLSDFKKKFKEDYEKDYQKVEVVDVFIDVLQIPASKN